VKFNLISGTVGRHTGRNRCVESPPATGTTATNNAPTYLFEASERPSLPLHPVPLIEATEQSLAGYGCLVDDPDGFEIEIVRGPAPGWRPVDAGTGDEGGIVEGIFHGIWTGDVLMGRNEAVGGEYVLGWSRDPQTACARQAPAPRDQALLWHRTISHRHIACWRILPNFL
jgi:hypothetical protein